MDTERTEHTEFLEEAIERFNTAAARTFDALENTISDITRDLQSVKDTIEREIDNGSN